MTGTPVAGELANNTTYAKNKPLQIVDCVWPDPVPKYDTFSIDSDIEFRVGRKINLDKVTIEEWGYANIQIMRELMKPEIVQDIAGYLKYTADVYRLASKYVWYSVLVYDKEYRETQANENCPWGTYRQDIREFQLVPKRDHPTARAMQEISSKRDSYRPTVNNIGGPFASDGRNICRNFNGNLCNHSECKIAQVSAICMPSAHSAKDGHGGQQRPSTNSNNLISHLHQGGIA